jgi:hypothetical protein
MYCTDKLLSLMPTTDPFSAFTTTSRMWLCRITPADSDAQVTFEVKRKNIRKVRMTLLQVVVFMLKLLLDTLSQPLKRFGRKVNGSTPW